MTENATHTPCRTMLIVNPKSGVNSKEAMRELIMARFEQIGLQPELRLTERAGHATELARQAAAEGYDTVAVVGGDGTVNETASALVGTDTALAIVPSGSGNGLARHLGIPIDEAESIDLIGRRNIECIDCGDVDGRLFFCTFGIGFDGLISHRFAREKRRGRATYIKNVLREFAHRQPMPCTVRVDGREIDCHSALIVSCCNASQYGNNAFIAPTASVSDGLLDLVVIPDGSVFGTLLAGFDIMVANLIHNHNIHLSQGACIEVELPEATYAHLDGEPVMAGPHATIRCRHRALKVYTNPDRKPLRPFITPFEATLHDHGLALRKLLGIH